MGQCFQGVTKHLLPHAFAFILGTGIPVWDPPLNPEVLAESRKCSIEPHSGMRGASIRFGEREFPAHCRTPRLRRVRRLCVPWSELARMQPAWDDTIEGNDRVDVILDNVETIPFRQCGNDSRARPRDPRTFRALVRRRQVRRIPTLGRYRDRDSWRRDPPNSR